MCDKTNGYKQKNADHYQTFTCPNCSFCCDMRHLQAHYKEQKKEKAKARLEYLRQELRAERMSYGELAELQSLAPFIDKGDIELLEPAGVPEFSE